MIMRGGLKLLILGGAAVLAAEIYMRAPVRSGARGGAEAPAFTLPDLSGRPVSLQSLKGRVVAVNFWATWCQPCREEIPDLAKVYAAHREGCFEMLGVAEESGTREEVEASARKFGINYPVLLDDGGAVGDAFRIPGYPRTYLIDGEGTIRKVFDGPVETAELDTALQPLLAEARGCSRRL
jgi:cytochrome c biogenesis protein CcmG, thiol:disulfide interchange protein DsbE